MDYAFQRFIQEDCQILTLHDHAIDNKVYAGYFPLALIAEDYPTGAPNLNIHQDSLDKKGFSSCFSASFFEATRPSLDPF